MIKLPITCNISTSIITDEHIPCQVKNGHPRFASYGRSLTAATAAAFAAYAACSFDTCSGYNSYPHSQSGPTCKHISHCSSTGYSVNRSSIVVHCRSSVQHPHCSSLAWPICPCKLARSVRVRSALSAGRGVLWHSASPTPFRPPDTPTILARGSFGCHVWVE